jgi:hypothetical protein
MLSAVFLFVAVTTTAHLCIALDYYECFGGGQGGTYVSVPRNITCNIPDPHNVTYVIGSMYVPKRKPVESAGIRCQKVTRKTCTNLGFWGSKGNVELTTFLVFASDNTMICERYCC